MTVLLADIVDSTSLVEGLDPEEANDVLLPLTEAMRQAVTRYGGIVTAVEGDGIMALFGAPVADEHHAIGACFASLDIPRLVKSANVDVDVRIGVHSGEVLVHAEGDEMSYNYVATGTDRPSCFPDGGVCSSRDPSRPLRPLRRWRRATSAPDLLERWTSEGSKGPSRYTSSWARQMPPDRGNRA